CLRGAIAPHDIDLGVVIHRDGLPLPYQPPPHPFAPPSEFDLAARPLALRKPRLISLLHIEEVRAIGAPHRLIWDARRGGVENEPVRTPPRTSETISDHGEKLRLHADEQAIFDAFVQRVQSIAAWPVAPAIE